MAGSRAGPKRGGFFACEARAQEPVTRYLITGGAGFIGSHVAEALVAQDHRVAILDDFSTGRPANVEDLVVGGSAAVIEGSVADARLVDRLMAGCDRCVHLAAAVGVKLVVAQPLETLRGIVLGSDVVIAAAARHGKRLLFASTSEIYGKSSDGPLGEDSDRVLGSAFKSRWSYALAKSYGEALAYGYHRERGADAAVARLFNTIGSRQLGAHGMVVPRLVRQAISGEELTVYGDGTQSRCFLHVDDAVAAVLALADHDQASGRAFNIGSSEPITILSLARRIVERAGSSSAIVFVPYERAYEDGFEELGRRTPDTTALQALTGWRSRRSLDQALDDVIAYQRAELAAEASGRPRPEAIRAQAPA